MTSVHPLAIASLSSSVLAYASAFVGSPALLWPALGVAVVAILAGMLARRAIRAEPGRFGGGAVALAGLLSGAAFVLLGVALVALSRGAATP